MTTTSAEGLPELPRGILWRSDAQGWQSVDYSLFPSVGRVRYAYDEDQMRAYGELCRRTASPAEGRLARDSYDVGWIECTNWAKRDDLVADMGSPAYMADRARNLAGLTKSPADSPATLVTEDMKSAVRWAPSSAYWSSRLREFFGPDARDGIFNLEAQVRDLLCERDELRTLAKKPEGDECVHDWVIADNSRVTNASLCMSCGMIAPTDSRPKSSQASEAT